MVDETLVVLGAAVWPGGRPSPTLLRRTEWACRLFAEGGYDLLVLSGALGIHPPAEAEVMAKIALDRGVPRSALVLDRGARTTIETAAFAATMAGSAERRYVAVTDLYHAPRTWLAFRAYGLKARLSCPPLGQATSRRRLATSFLREIPALGLYLSHYVRLRAVRRRTSVTPV